MEVELENIDCNFCNSSSSKEYDADGEWKIVECSNCGFCYTNPRPSLEALPTYYTEEYFKDKRFVNKFYNPDGSDREVIEEFTNRVEDVETFVEKRKSVLDIGSARGGFLGVLQKRGWSVFGVEISNDAAQIANEIGIPTYCGEYLNYEPDSKLNVICMYQTLEHVFNPKQVIEKAYKDLEKDGVFIVEIPNLDCFELKYSKTRKHLSYDLPRHLNHFRPKLLVHEMTKAGFEIVDVNIYPPKNLLKLMGFISKFKNSGKNTIESNRQTDVESKSDSLEIPLLKRNFGGLKLKFIKFYSSIFQGWRFTVVAKK